MSSRRNHPLAPVASSASSQKTAVVESEDISSDRNDWQQAHYYHLFPAAPRYPVSAYCPPRRSSATPAELPIAENRFRAPEPAIRHTSGLGEVSTWGLRVPSRTTHIKGTACVVAAIALVFIVVLVIALVSNRENP
ncbi:hypothetical protein F5B22DRAFT_227925 [Xylaria bambusicola]|uniref:uncharacterized protein n=1 Tax=Xylaria bambusicola TaxID=326684 RepID=UPI0020087B66|nr:uncharacterized protein F5B22DRAFT_227925 [Xylaria bambusicola]KAI0514692.1 hypothetical protein F5B22DRAFT_227925 [Xylaria bambusicola]